MFIDPSSEDILKQNSAIVFAKFVFRNLVDIAALLAAVIVSIRHQVVPYQIDVLVAWMLGILALMAFSSLWGRNRRLARIESLAQENHDLVSQAFGESVKAKNFFIENENYLHQISRSKFENAKQIYLSGMSLRRTIRTLQPVLEHRVIAGAHVKIIILDGKRLELMEELVLRSAGAKKAKGWQEVIENVRDDIQTVVQRLPKNTRGTIELGFLPYIPSFGLALVNPGERYQENKICYVELYHHRSTDANPTFIINHKDDEAWFSFYANQFDLLWKSCVNIEKYPAE
jgi:hypothetical protein